MGEGVEAVEGVSTSIERMGIGWRTYMFALFLTGIGEFLHLLLRDADSGHVLQVEVAEGGEIGGSVNQVGELLFGQQLEVFIGRTEESGCNAISGSHTVGTCLEGSGETFNVAHHHHGGHLTVFLLAVLQY